MAVRASIDKETARAAFAAGREWAYWSLQKEDYDEIPPAFEEWWTKLLAQENAV